MVHREAGLQVGQLFVISGSLVLGGNMLVASNDRVGCFRHEDTPC